MNDIDNLFHKKLKDFEPKTPPGSWEKLQGELDKKEQKRPVWWYYIAASLVLIIVSVVLFKADFPSQQDGLADTKPLIKKLSPKPIIAESKTPSIAKLEIEKVTPQVAVREKGGNKVNSWQKDKIKKDRDENGMLGKVTENLNLDSISHTDPNFAFHETTDHQADLTRNENVKDENSPVAEPITIIIKRGSPVLAHSVDTTEKNSFRRTRIGRVYTQVLNFKNGEKVDLKELGLGESLLAANKKNKQTQK